MCACVHVCTCVYVCVCACECMHLKVRELFKSRPLFIYFICLHILLACMSVHHIPAGAHRGQKRLFNSLELESQVVVSHHVGARN